MADDIYPQINGFVHDFTSIDFRMVQTRVVGIMSLEWKPVKKGKDIYGAGVNPIARTRGTASYTGSFEVLLDTWNRLKVQLRAVAGRGPLDQPFTIQAAFGPSSPTATTTQLVACVIQGSPVECKQGDDPVTVKCDFSYMQHIEDGVELIPDVDAA